MDGIISSTNCYVKHTGSTKGRGVYAKRGFEPGDIIEESPIIIIFRPSSQLPFGLQTMVFNWGSLAKTSDSSAIALGFGSLYNHSNNPNLNFSGNLNNQSLVFTCNRSIEKDEELTISYSGKDSESWFFNKSITLLK